jgi:hypothetical protein
MSTQKEISERWQMEKLQCLQAKEKSVRDCREKTPMSSQKIRKTPKAHPWSFLFPSHTIFDIRLFLLQKASSNPKTDPGKKRKKKRTLFMVPENQQKD